MISESANTDDVIIQLLIYVGYALAVLMTLLLLRKQMRNFRNKKKLMKISNEIGLDGVYPDIFVSFSSKDIKIGEQLFYKLHDHELNPWISSRKIQAGEDYSLKILDAIDNSKLFILLISIESTKSRHVKAELERAFSKEREIFPIRLDNSEIPKSWEYFLSTSQWIDVDGLSTKKWINEMIEIFKEKFGESVGDTIDNLLESFRSFEGDETQKG